jgi:hypothetical protein
MSIARNLAAAFGLMTLVGCTDPPTAPVDPFVPPGPTGEGAQTQRWRIDLSGLGMGAIWGASPSLLFTSGGDGFLARFDGVRWEALPTGVDGWVGALWGTAGDNVYATSEDRILRFDGHEWSTVYRSAGQLRDVWGSSATDVFAVGENGTIIHGDGNEWSLMSSGVDWPLTTVEGSGPNHVFAWGLHGGAQTVLRWDGSAWRQVPVQTGVAVVSLAVDPSGGAWACDTQGWVYGGASGTLYSFYQLRAPATALAGPGHLELLGVDVAGDVFHWAAGGSPEWRGFSSPVRSLWSAPWGFVYGVGLDGQIVYRDGSSWLTLRDAHEACQLNAVFGAPDGARFVVGSGKSFVLFDQTDWLQQTLGDPRGDRAGWAVSRDFALAVGREGTINRWTGAGWQVDDSPVTSRLTGVWASDASFAVAVAYDGSVLTFDGSSWTLSASLGTPLYDVHGTSPDDLFACAAAGQIFHFDGTGWTVTRTPASTFLHSVWAESPTDVIAVGGGGQIVQYDGSAWRMLPSGTTNDFLDVWVQGPASAFALTSTSVLLRFDGTSWTQVGTTPGAWRWTCGEAGTSSTPPDRGRQCFGGGSRTAARRWPPPAKRGFPRASSHIRERARGRRALSRDSARRRRAGSPR